MKDYDREAKIKVLYERLAACYTKNDPKPVYTPRKLAQEMLAKIPKLHGEILVVSDLGLLLEVLLMAHQVKGVRITFIAHTPEQEAFSQSLMVKTWQVGYNNSIEELEKHLMGMKFDVVVANPPYGNLHLKFMKMCVEHLTEDGVFVSVQPVRWLQDPLWKVKKSSDAKKMEPVLTGKLDDIHVISSLEAGKIFEASFGMDLGIFVVKNAGGNTPYESLSNKPWGINIQGLKHLIKENNFLFDKFDGTQQNFVPIASILADGSGRGFSGTTFCHQQYGYFVDGKSRNCKYGDGLTLSEAHRANKHRTNGKTEGALIKSFNTPIEAENFYNFIRLDAFRFFIYIFTRDVNVPLQFLPFPSEADAFKTPWTNERFYEYFQIAEPEQKVIEETMKQFPLE